MRKTAAFLCAIFILTALSGAAAPVEAAKEGLSGIMILSLPESGKLTLDGRELKPGQAVLAEDLSKIKYIPESRTEQYFSYVAAFGAFSWFSYTTDQNLKNALGHTAYIHDGIKDLSKIKPYAMRITANGIVHEGTYIFGAVSNSTSIAGLDFRRDNLESSSGNIDNGANTFAAYLQHEMRIYKGLNFTAGARLTAHEDFGTNLSPKVALMYSLKDINFRLTYSRGFRTPGLDELHYNYFSVNRGKPQISIGSKDLDPETSDYFSANAEYNTDFITISATAFINSVDDMIIKKNIKVDDAKRAELMALFPEMTADQAAKLEQYALYCNSDKGRVKGFNLNLSALVTRDLDFGVNYSWNYAKTKSAEGWALLERSVRNTVTLSSNYHHQWGIYALNVRLSGRLQSRTYYPGYENAPGYGVWNLNTTHSIKISEKFRIEPSLGVDNIFDRVDRRPDSSLRKYALYSPGRMIVVGLRLSFN